jgi:addiction module RelB/DinJ family antitoxin
MKNTTNLNIRIDADLKRRAEALFNELGMNLSTAMTIFLKNSLRYGGIPFELRTNQDSRSAEEMKADIMYKVKESEDDVVAGRVMDAEDALAKARKKYGI